MAAMHTVRGLDRGSAVAEPSAGADDAEPATRRGGVADRRRDLLDRGMGGHGERRHADCLTPYHSRHACVGMVLPGFARRTGSNTDRIAHMASSDASEKVDSMYASLSR